MQFRIAIRVRHYVKISERFLKDFWENTEGNYSLIIGLLLLPLMFAVGVGVDSARLRSAETKIQAISDQTAIRSAIAYREAEARRMHEARFDGKLYFKDAARSHDELTVKAVRIERPDGSTFRVESDSSLKPTFLQIFGYPKYDIKVVSEVSLGNTPGAEIVFAVDTTNSMNFGSNWSTSMDAIGQVLDEIAMYTGKDGLFVSVVPFQDRVNIGKSMARRSWIDGSPPTTASPNDWRGCVEPRYDNEPGLPWAVNDDLPSTQKFEYSTKFMNNDLGNSSRGIRCSPDEIYGPTNDVEQVKQFTKSLNVDGTGRFDVGMAWAWRMLSPKWSNQWGQTGYPSKNTSQRKKFIVFLSDGMSTTYHKEMSKEQDWGRNQGSKQGFKHFEAVCDKAKAQGIQVYVLQIEGNPNATKYFERCASSPSHYSMVKEPKDIEPVFDDILVQYTAMLRITK